MNHPLAFENVKPVFRELHNLQVAGHDLTEMFNVCADRFGERRAHEIVNEVKADFDYADRMEGR